MKNFSGYFFITLLITFILLGVYKLQSYIMQLSQEAFDVWPFLIYALLLNIGIGIIFGIPALIIRIKNGNIKRFNCAKFFGICTPALIIALQPLLSYGRIPVIRNIIPIEFWGTTLLEISAIIFGYVLVDCIRTN
ncbi:hypothetical protein VBD025_17965 [Virgibacillus flavescens]|uniref:hypothetical protein n=1 Tax=Virgibacillus flavescens TaxID=1611422 RepID=UPI003D3318FE